jgi:hypothetical protein
MRVRLKNETEALTCWTKVDGAMWSIFNRNSSGLLYQDLFDVFHN